MVNKTSLLIVVEKVYVSLVVQRQVECGNKVLTHKTY